MDFEFSGVSVDECPGVETARGILAMKD